MTATPYQLFPALDASTEAALRASIDRFGVLVPVAKDQHGNIIDGHHRARIATELGVSYRVDVIRAESAEHAREMAATLNMTRRHMTQKQRLDVVLDLLLDVDEYGTGRHSTTAIANAVGVDQAQVVRDQAELMRAHKLDPQELPEKRKGLDGKVRPARRPTVVPTSTPRDESKAQQSITELGDAAPAGTAGVREVTGLVRSQRRAERTAEAEALATDDAPEIRAGDFRDVLVDIPDGSVDLILTDPPYGDAALPSYSALGEFAAAKLKPGGSLICYTGQSILPGVYAALGEHLRYWWTISLDHRHGGQQLPGKWVMVEWKPLVWFVRDNRAGRHYVGDKVRGSRPDKDAHEWAQGIDEVFYLIEQLAEPGDLVVDPFAGSGAFGRAALTLGRRFIGADLDPGAYRGSIVQ